MDVVVSHVNADFDSLGGLVGASQLYRGAVMVLPGGEGPDVRDFLRLHQDLLPIRRPTEIDPEAITRLIVVDTASGERLGPAREWASRPDVELHLFDHHPQTPADLRPHWSRIEPWGAVSSILADELFGRGQSLAAFEATALLLGIYSDTGSLSFGGTRPQDLRAAAWLLEQGADLDVIAQFLRQALTPQQRDLLRELVNSAETVEIRGAPVTFASAGPGPYIEGVAPLVNRLMEAEESSAAFALAEMGGDLYLIARSRTDAIDVGAVLRELGGGGHPRAASARCQGGSAGEARVRLMEALERSIAPERTAREIMSYPVRVVSPQTTVEEARRSMIRYGHSGLVVTDASGLRGVVTRRDLDKARHHRLEHAPVEGFMTREVRTVPPDAPLSALEEQMIHAGIGRLPVVRDGTVEGIVTRTDVLKARFGTRYLSGAHPRDESPPQLLRERLPAPIQQLLEQVGTVAAREGTRAYAVGGFVRDLLLGVRNLDVDVVAEPDGIALARAFGAAAGGAVKTHPQFGTAKVKLPDGRDVDFATARTEAYPRPGALPEVEVSSIVDDLRRRDFTINAMALSLEPVRFGDLLDPFGGSADLERRRIRVLHRLSFIEDPTRLFRGVRFEQRFHFRMDADTEEQARRAVREGVLGRITAERLREELFRCFREAKPLPVLQRLADLGVVEWLQPDLALDPQLISPAAGALEWWKKRTGSALPEGGRRLLYLGLLLAPLGDARALSLAESRMRLPPPKLQLLGCILDAARRAAEWLDGVRSPAEITRVLKELPDEALVALRIGAGLPGRAADGARERLDRFLSDWRSVKLEITGSDLKELGYPAGPRLGEALRVTLDARINGRIAGRAAELAFAREWLQKHGVQRQGDR